MMNAGCQRRLPAPFVPMPCRCGTSPRRLGLGQQNPFASSNPYVKGAAYGAYGASTAAQLIPLVESGAPLTKKIGGALIAAGSIPTPATPFLLAAGAIASLFTGGCGAPCTTSATTEQVYEVAADDIYSAAAAGFISGSQAVALIQQTLAAGQQQMAQLAQSDPKAQGGMQNMTRILQSIMNRANAIGAATKAFDLQSAMAGFKNPNTKGWEPGTVSAGNGLAQQALASIAGSTSSSASPQTAAKTGGSTLAAGATIQNLLAPLTSSTGLLLGALAVGLILAFG